MPIRELAALLFAMIYPTVVAWLYFLFLVEEAGEPNLTQQLAYGLGKGFQFLFPVLYLWLVEFSFPRPARPRWVGLRWGLAFALAVVAAMLALYFGLLRDSDLFLRVPGEILLKLEELGLDSRPAFLTLALGLSLLHSLLEEYYWRWFVFGRLRKRTRFWQAALVSSLAFMAHHVLLLSVFFPGYFFSAVLPFSLAVAVGGFFWSWLYERTGTIYPAWISHAIVDLGIFFIAFDLLTQADFI